MEFTKFLYQAFFKNFRENNFITKKFYCKLISRNNSQMIQIFRKLHTVIFPHCVSRHFSLIENFREIVCREFTLIVSLTKNSDLYRKRKLQKFALTIFTQKLRQINALLIHYSVSCFHERFFITIVSFFHAVQRVWIKIRCLCFTNEKNQFHRIFVNNRESKIL